MPPLWRRRITIKLVRIIDNRPRVFSFILFLSNFKRVPTKSGTSGTGFLERDILGAPMLHCFSKRNQLSSGTTILLVNIATIFKIK